MIGLSAVAAAQERSTKDSDKDALSLKGRQGQGKIGDSQVTFDFRENGDLVITGKLKGKGTWTQTGATVFMETTVSTFKGTITGNGVSGQRTLKEDKQSVSEWSAQLGEPAAETSYIEDHPMEAMWIAIAIVAGLVLAIVVPVCVVQWAGVRRAEVDARVMQDMLARGLSVEEIKRLLNPSPGPAMPPKSPPASRPSETSLALASAVASMAAAEKDTDEIAAFLDAFLRRQGWPQETSREPNQELQR
jgi:hypothetical protein